MTRTAEGTSDELVRRHRAAAVTVLGLIALTALFVALAFAGVLTAPARTTDPFVEGALRIAIVLFGLGAVALRRTKFNAARLQDIAALGGTSALLATLQNTTMLVALLGGAIAVMGLFITVISGDRYNMLWLGLIAAAVLLYCYPRRAAWRRVVDATQTEGGLSGADAPSVKGNIA